MSDIVTRLRQTRANMLGTDDEQHYWDCHEAADAIERLRLTDAERAAADGVLEQTNHDAAPAARAQVDAAGISRQGTGDTPDSQPTPAQGSVRGECTEHTATPSAGVSYGKDDAKRRIANMSGQWIPVTERMPPAETIVLGWANRVVLSFWRDGGWVDTLYGWHLPNGPTHWMPIPAPPTDAK